MAVFDLVLGLLLGGVGLALLARHLRVPWPALLALAGAALAFVPGAPDVTLEPDLALARTGRPISGLVLGAVGLTVAAVAGAVRWLEPSQPWAASVTRAMTCFAADRQWLAGGAGSQPPMHERPRAAARRRQKAVDLVFSFARWRSA